MHKGIEIVGYIFATIGTAYVVKHIMHRKERRSGWHKIEIVDEKSNDEPEPPNLKVDDNKSTVDSVPDTKTGDKIPTGSTSIQFQQSKGIFNFTFL